MSTTEILDKFLGKKTRTTEKDLGDGTKQVCDLDTGDCYIIRMKDGLIERVDHVMSQNKKIQVEESYEDRQASRVNGKAKIIKPEPTEPERLYDENVKPAKKQ